MEKVFITHIIRVGSGHGIIVPVDILRGVKIERGDYVIFTNFGEGTFTVNKVPAEKIIEWKKL